MTWQAVSSHSVAIQVVEYSHPGASQATGSRIQPAGSQPPILFFFEGVELASQEKPGDGLTGRIQPSRSHPGSQDTDIQESARQQDPRSSQREASIPYQI